MMRFCFPTSARVTSPACAHGCNGEAMNAISSVKTGRNSKRSSGGSCSTTARSIRCRSSPAMSSRVSPGSMLMRLCGKLSLNSRSTGGSSTWQIEAVAPMRRRPRPHLPSNSIPSRAAAISRSTTAACLRRCSPAWVSITFLPSLSKSRQPMSVSSAFIEWLTALCVRKSSRAVWVKLPVRARIRNAWSCRLSRGPFINERGSSYPSDLLAALIRPSGPSRHLRR